MVYVHVSVLQVELTVYMYSTVSQMDLKCKAILLAE